MKVSIGRLKQLIREATGQVVGWWISPVGELIEVPPGKEHVDVSMQLLNSDDDEHADDAFISHGALKMRMWTPNEMSIVAREINNDTLRRIQDAVNKLGIAPHVKVSLIGKRTLASYGALKTTVAELAVVRSLKDLDPYGLLASLNR